MNTEADNRTGGTGPAEPADRVRLTHLAAALLILAAVLYAYLTPLTGGLTYYSADTTDINYVMLRSHVEDLRSQGFTAWTSHVATGHYRAADPTYGIWSPRTTLYLLFRGYNAQIASIILYAWLAGLGAYVLGRVLTGRTFPALYLGLVWPLSGCFVSMVLNIPYFTSAAWTPWLLAAWLGLERTRTRIALTGLTLALVAVEGDLPGMGVAALVLATVTAISPGPAGRVWGLVHLALAAALAVGVSAVAWLPAMEVLPESRRAGGLSADEALAFSLHPLRLVNLVAPRFFGQMHEKSLWAVQLTNSIQGQGFWHQTIYLGLFAPLLGIAALAVPGKRRLAWALLAPMTVLALLAFGRYTPILELLMKHLPPLRLFRYPAKLFMWSSLLLLALSGLGLGRLEPALATARIRRPAALISFLLLAAAAVALHRFMRESWPAIQSQSPRPSLSFIRMTSDLVRVSLFSLLCPVLVLAAASPRKSIRKSFAPLVLAIAFLDLATAQPVLSMNPRRGLEASSNLLGALAEHGPGRLLVDQKMYKYINLGPRPSLRPNWGVLDHVEYAFGASATISGRIFNLEDVNVWMESPENVFRLLAAPYLVTSFEPTPDWAKHLERTGAIQTLDRRPADNLQLFAATTDKPRALLFPEATLVEERDQALNLAMRDQPPHRLYLPRDSALGKGRPIRPEPPPPKPGGGAGRILSLDDRGDELTVRTACPDPAWLALRDYPMSGWRAWVDETEKPIYFADGIGRAVLVPAGEHQVNFRFRPPGLRWGGALTILSLVAVFLLCRFRVRRPS